MNSKPIFSVIIPTYNREHFLKRTIDSILTQTFKDFELIIVDDGSTDNTKALVDTYEDTRIIYFYKENGGQNSAVNMGLQNARGEYIAFCDSDDTWMPEKLEKCLKKYQEDKEIKVVYSFPGLITTENGEQKVVAFLNDGCEGWCYKEVMEQGNLVPPSFLTCKKECFDVVGLLPNDVFSCQDSDLSFRLCKHFKVGLVREILGIYNTDATGRIMSQKKRGVDDYVKFLNNWGNEIVDVCGIGLLVRRYLEASWAYMEIDEVDLARDMYRYVCTLEGGSLEEVKNKVIHELQGEQKILIYGTGDWGKKIYRMLEILEIQNLLFTETRVQQEAKTLYGIPIIEMGEGLYSYIDNPLIIASSAYYDEMEKIAKSKGFYHIVSYKQIKDMMFDRKS